MQRETESELAGIRHDVQKMEGAIKDERVKWIEDEVEELERWDGME